MLGIVLIIHVCKEKLQLDIKTSHTLALMNTVYEIIHMRIAVERTKENEIFAIEKKA